jgi:hypothetical protein
MDLNQSDVKRSKVYDSSNPRAGAAVIFNQMFFKRHSTREGTDKDAIDLANTLADIGFDVKICNDFSADRIKTELLDCEFVFDILLSF